VKACDAGVEKENDANGNGGQARVTDVKRGRNLRAGAAGLLVCLRKQERPKPAGQRQGSLEGKEGQGSSVDGRTHAQTNTNEVHGVSFRCRFGVPQRIASHRMIRMIRIAHQRERLYRFCHRGRFRHVLTFC